MSFRDKVNRAADRAGLSVKNPVATDAFALLVHTMIECGQVKIPYGGTAILAEVMQERTGHTVTGGSFRWYVMILRNDPEYVARFVTLPAAFETLVRKGKAA